MIKKHKHSQSLGHNSLPYNDLEDPNPKFPKIKGKNFIPKKTRKVSRDLLNNSNAELFLANSMKEDLILAKNLSDVLHDGRFSQKIPTPLSKVYNKVHFEVYLEVRSVFEL